MFTKEVAYYGITSYRFVASPDNFVDPHGNSSAAINNRDYCTPSGTLRDCHTKAGVLNISVCRDGVPTVTNSTFSPLLFTCAFGVK